MVEYGQRFVFRISTFSTKAYKITEFTAETHNQEITAEISLKSRLSKSKKKRATQVL